MAMDVRFRAGIRPGFHCRELGTSSGYHICNQKSDGIYMVDSQMFLQDPINVEKLMLLDKYYYLYMYIIHSLCKFSFVVVFY